MARLAPEFTLSKVGEASGLRVMVCNNAPATARLAPKIMPTNARGKRKSVRPVWKQRPWVRPIWRDLQRDTGRIRKKSKKIRRQTGSLRRNWTKRPAGPWSAGGKRRCATHTAGRGNAECHNRIRLPEVQSGGKKHLSAGHKAQDFGGAKKSRSINRQTLSTKLSGSQGSS